nr:reverse transcriptase domain-containing protein [Tanacetum cinerariifolium]
MANTTPLVTTVTKPAINPGDADTIPRVNIQEFYEEYYEDILPIIMKKVRHDRRKDAHTILDFGKGPRERIREDSYHSSVRARATKPERVKVQDRLRYGDRHVLDRLGHRRQSAFDRLSETYSPSTTKSLPQETDFKDPPRGKSRARGLNTSREDHPKDREPLSSAGESYDDSFSHSYRDGNRSRHMKRRRDNKSPPFGVSRRAARVWFDELPPESIGSYKDLKAVFLAYFMQQNKYVKHPVEIHNIKQKDGETIEDFMERFKVEIERMKGDPECIRISGFMHGVNNPELTKRLNEHVPKTMEEMMITTAAFIRGEAAAASKKKGHASWKAQDRSKRKNSDKRSDFRGHSREERGSNRFTPLTRTPKEILAAEASKFQPPPPMVTPIEELVRAGKLSHLIEEIKHGRDQSNAGKKETAAKDKPTEIYMVQSWQRTVRQKATQSFERVKEITFPPLTASSGTEGPLIIEAEVGGHMIHRIYVDGGDTNHSTRVWMNIMIVRSLSPYNDIIGRPGIRAIQAVPSTVHGMLKFPVEEGIVTICSTILIPTECTSVITSSVVSSEEMTRPANLKVALHPDFPDQEVAIGGTLSDKGRTELCSILKKNLGIFAWQPSDMKGVPRGPKLVEAGIMREVYYHNWLSNPVMVKKHDGSWRMCVDFTYLNKACPQDCYPLPEIDWKFESLCGYPFKCFLDAYKGYHQIQLADSDEEKTAFHTGQRVYCYTKMPFGLKNAGAIYQRLMDKAFESQIGRNIEVYVDDLVIKSHTEDEMMRDIEETFRTLHKTAAVLQLPSPRTIKEVQSLNGKLASPNRFLSKSAEKSLPLFQTLKKCIKKSDFHWIAEAEQAFKQLKQHLSELPLLVAPKPKEELIIYLSATHGAINAVLMIERGTVQTLIYLISRALQGPELNYSPMEKLVLSLVFAAKRLRRYFQARPITVVTNQPIKQVMSRPDVAGRLQKWSIMLREHNITYRPRTSVKGQILADFLIEMPGENPQAVPAAKIQHEPWTLFTDGSSCVDGSGAGLILINPEGIEFTYALRFQFAASNNEAEYEALIAGLRVAAQMGVKDVHVSVNSKLVSNQVLGTYVAKKDNIVKYLQIVKSLVSGFTTFSISQVPQSKNKKADALSKIASTSFAHLSKQVLVEILKDKSIKEEVATVIEEDGPTWMTPIVDYLNEGTLPGDKKEARKLCLKARQYELIEGTLYRWPLFTPWLRCVGPLQAEYMMREIHEGSCSMHAGPRSAVAKAIRLGYYWPTMHRDARDMIQKYNNCQIHRPITRSPQQPLTLITSPWPFYKWRIDIAGPFPEGPGKVKFFIVAMDYFTKWIEAKAVATITGGQSNGLVERANRSLGEGIKSRLGEGNRNWVEELPDVFWAHRTMIKSSHGDIPFSLTYRTEAVIPTEIGMPTYRTAAVDVVGNNKELRLNLDLLEERRERAAICEAKAKLKMTKYYNARVRSVTFKPGDFVYRSNDASHAVAGGKLRPKWEGPYEVTEALGDGAYKLRSRDGTILPRTWNIANLKRCYL